MITKTMTGVAIAAFVATMAAFVLFVALAPVPPTKEDTLIEYLDDHGVTYSSRDDMLRLADDLCGLLDQGVNIEEFLGIAFTPRDAMTITYGVTNGGYCAE